MGGGGSETTTQETVLPDWITDAAKSNLARADDISRIGYVPNMLPQVAAFSPQQEAAFGNTNDMASAFGMQGGGGGYLPEAQEYAGGVKGYGTWDMAQQGIDQLRAERPGQYEAISGMFIDPSTGQGGSFADSPMVAQQGGGRGIDALNMLHDGGALSSSDYLSSVLNSGGPNKTLNEWDGDSISAINKVSGK